MLILINTEYAYTKYVVNLFLAIFFYDLGLSIIKNIIFLTFLFFSIKML